jgi:hypothetical protein
MNNIKTRSGMLMTRGVMKMKTDPPSFVCSVRTFKHPQTNVTVTLHPIPNIASRTFFNEMSEQVHLDPKYDIILCEDGRLPFIEGSAEARKVQFFRTIFPIFSHRPVVPSSCTKFEGVTTRDPAESRMAWTSVTQSLSPGVDPRARRAVERMESYADGTRVVCPWNIYHHVYFSDKLAELGYELVEDREAVVINQKQILGLVAVMFIMSMMGGMFVVRVLFGM